jgi:hypothetical protein
MEKASARLEEIISESITIRRITEKFSKLLEILQNNVIINFNSDLQ